MSKRTSFVIALFSCRLAFASGGAFAGTIWYVKADAGGQNNGMSWEDAFTELQSALAVVESGDEVWVAAGTYLPDYDVNSGEHTLDREGTFQLMNGVEVYGGFVGGETRRDQRNPNPNTNGTVLSGDLLGDDGPNFENNDENSYHVTTGSGTDENAVLDGFTVKAGNADERPDNDGGAGMYNNAGSPTVGNCTFSGNWAYEGGGMHNDSFSHPTLTNCTFTDNSASAENGGGGMCNFHSSPTLTDCTFNSNSSAVRGGGMYNGWDSNPALTDCAFSGNSAKRDGGGVANYYDCWPTLVNCTFSGNSAEKDGGGMDSNYECNPTLTNCTFSGNSANRDGGGMANYLRCEPKLTNCILWGNMDQGGQGEFAQIHGGTPVIKYSCIQGCQTHCARPRDHNIGDDPRFVTGPVGDFYLSQRAAGQPKNSPCVDTGSDTAKNLGLNQYTTRTDEAGDQDIVDMGYHYPISGVNCDLIKRLKVNCKGKPDKFKIKATVKSDLGEGAELTLILDGSDEQVVTTEKSGKAKAKWRKVEPGDHEVCIVECPDICDDTSCKP